MAQTPPETPPASTSAGTPGAWEDPYRRYNFRLEIQGVTAGHFTECRGLGVDVEAYEYQEAGSSVTHRIPGRTRYQDITLSYGVTVNHDLFDWMMTAVNGNPNRKNVSVLLLDSTGASVVGGYDLIMAWPSGWRGAPLDALGSGIAIESITLVCQEMHRRA
jgi:phage tail-like protein